MNNGERLTFEIVELSESGAWQDAKLERGLYDVYYEEEPDTCLCGHYPIIEICVLKNYNNNKEAIVGNHCVKKFLGLSSDKFFQAFRRVKNDNEKSLNSEMIDHAYKNRWISDWENSFYQDIMRKRNLTDKQLHHKTKINKKVLTRFQKSKPR